MVSGLGKGAGWDRVGKLTSYLWPGKAEGVTRKQLKPINFIPRGLVGSVDIQQWTSPYLQSKHTFTQAIAIHRHYIQMFKTYCNNILYPYGTETLKQRSNVFNKLKVSTTTDILLENHKTICCSLQIVNTNYRGTQEKK